MLAVGGVGDDGTGGPQGANVLVAAPTQGASPHAITTTDITGAAGYNAGSTNDLSDLDYTRTFNGTSAATPLVTGAVALILSVRPELTWRDVRRVLALSARKNDPLDSGLDDQRRRPARQPQVRLRGHRRGRRGGARRHVHRGRAGPRVQSAPARW